VSTKRIALLLLIHEKTVGTHIGSYLKGGFELLCKKIQRPKKSKLNQQQQVLFREVLLHKKPNEVGLSGNIWTGQLMRQYLKASFDVHYNAGIYDLLERMGLTHQKAHADYGNAQVAAQQAFGQELENTLYQADEQTAVVFFDEFSVCEKPSGYYGWAEKNSRPTFTTNEKKEREQMDF